jgi:uncharacterized UPF0146 family protein
LNDTETGGWATFYYGVFSKVINDNNYKNVAEVGIGFGTHAKHILSNTNIDRLYLIDPMVYYPNDLFAIEVMKQEPESPGNNFNELYDLINNELDLWKKKYIWFRKPSLEITNEEIADDSLECIFIDGDHSYNAVLNDLRFWWKKLKQGGQMLGDDYWMDDVSKAVHDFANEKNIEIKFYEKKNTNYKIYVFSKL